MSVALKILSGVVVFALSYCIADLLSGIIYDNFIRDKIISSVSNALSTQTGALTQDLESLPSWVKLLSGDALVTFDIASVLEKDIPNTVEKAVSPYAHTFVRISFLPLLFIILSVLIKPLLKLLNRLVVNLCVKNLNALRQLLEMKWLY